MIGRMRGILRQKGYKLYKRPFELNVVGVRADSTTPNSFDDELHVFYKDDGGQWQYRVFEVTTDPGTYWLRHPMHELGTLILAEGQYVDAYKVGYHRGQYEAVVQAKPVTIMRDYDRDAVLDFMNGTEYTGMFGVNIHKTWFQGDAATVDKNSAGCTVFRNDAAFDLFLFLAKEHAKRYGNQLTYTLIDFRARRRLFWKRMTIGAGIAAAAGIGIAVAARHLQHPDEPLWPMDWPKPARKTGPTHLQPM